MSALCVAFIAESDQYREDEYQDIVRSITEYNDDDNTEVVIHWQEYTGNQRLEELNDKDILVVFTSENMTKCLDQGNVQTVQIKSNQIMNSFFELNGGELRRYLEKDENFRKTFVVESEDCEKVGFLSDIPAERTFDAADMDMEEFISKITTISTACKEM